MTIQHNGLLFSMHCKVLLMKGYVPHKKEDMVFLPQPNYLILGKKIGIFATNFLAQN